MVLPVFLLSACLGGGGSFDLDSVDTEAPRPAPKYQDVPSKKPEARKDQGGYGFAMRFKRRNWHWQANPKEDEIKLSEGDWEQTDDGNIKKPSKQQNIIDALPGNDGEALQDSSQEKQGISKVTDHHDFKYVWSGFFINIFELNLKKLVQRCQSEVVLTVIFFIKAKIPRDNSLYWDRLSIKGLGIS